MQIKGGLEAIKSSRFALFQPGPINQGHGMLGSEKASKSLFPKCFQWPESSNPISFFLTLCQAQRSHLGILQKASSASFSLYLRLTGSLLSSPAHLHSAWWRGWGRGPPELLCVRVDLIGHSPSQWDKPHHADSHRPMLSPAKFSWTAPGNSKLY